MAQMQRQTGMFSVDEQARMKDMIRRANAVGYLGHNWRPANFIRAAVNGAMDRLEPKLAELEKLRDENGVVPPGGKLSL